MGNDNNTDRRTKPTLQHAVAQVLRQGGNPALYRDGLAAFTGATLAEIDSVIAQAGSPQNLDSETVALDRLDDDRRNATRYPDAYKAWNHEE